MQKIKWEDLNTKIYYDEIDRIKNERGQWNIPDGEYFEMHHIKPKCFGGDGTRNKKVHHNNIIWLYAREHFILHKILAEDNPHNREMVYAFHRMSNSKKDNYDITPEDYELSRVLFAKMQHDMRCGSKASEITKERLSQSLRGKQSKRKGKKYPEMRDKLSKLFSGKGNPHFGKTTPQYVRDKISKSENGKFGVNNKKVICLETLVVYNSICAATRGEHACILGCLRTHKKHRITKRHYAFFTNEFEVNFNEAMLNAVELSKIADSTKSDKEKIAFKNFQQAGTAKTRKKVKCIELNRVFSSMSKAEQITGVDRGRIREVCKGERECTELGYHWEFV